MIIFLLFITGATARNYSNGLVGFKVFQILLKNQQQQRAMDSFAASDLFDFWSAPTTFDLPTTIMVHPKGEAIFSHTLNKENIQYKLLTNNIDSLIIAESKQQQRDLKRNSKKITFDNYYRYSDIENYIQKLAKDHSNIVSLQRIQTTYEKRAMYLVKIGSKCGNEPTILIDGGIHAREWISPAVVLYFIQQLVENRKNQHMIEHVNWYIIPLLNPDGYEYTHQGGKKRLWRLNRAPVKGGSCYGTDLNRNFDFHWNEVGTSQKLCANTFPGLSPFDQLETTALRNVVMQYKDQIKLYLSFHSYARMIVYPWSYTKELPNNAKELQYLGEKVAARISKVRGTKYTVNMSTHILPFTSGSSDDWVKGVGGVELAYTIELPEGKGGGGFILPPSDILDICVETFEGIKTFHNYIANKYK